MHTGLAGQRQRALVEDLVAAVPSHVFHHHDDVPGAVDQVHRAAHTLHHLSGDHPVGQIAGGGHLHGAEHRDVDVPSADHPERCRGVEERRPRQHRDRLLTRIDQVRVDGILSRVGPHTENPVLAVQDDRDTGREIVRYQRR